MRYINRYVFGMLVSAFLIVLIFIFSGSNNKPSHQTEVSSYSNKNSSVELYVRGAITAPTNHYEATVTVNSSQVTINVYQGYDAQLLTTKSYVNTENSYINFLKALDSVGYMHGNDSSSSPMGHCVFGETYQYRIYSNTNKIQDLWSGSCNSGGSYKGNISGTIDLFKSQVPDFNDIVSSTNLAI